MNTGIEFWNSDQAGLVIQIGHWAGTADLDNLSLSNGYFRVEIIAERYYFISLIEPTV